MKYAILGPLLFGLLAVVSPAPLLPQSTAPAANLSGFPFTNENLLYTVNWPTGLSLGEGHMSATREISGWRFELALDAGIPGFAVKDTYRSTSSLEFCSTSLTKEALHGTKKVNESITIDGSKGKDAKDKNTATRLMTSGATATIPLPACIRDALTYVFYARRELGQGRVPPAQQIIFGALYNASLEYAGAETVIVAEKRVLTDKIVVHIKGPASDITFDAYFDRDPARTPVSIRVPFPIGKFSLELVR